MRERRADVRRALSHAAITLASHRGGVDAVSVDDIARTARVSRRTFFNYFPAKGDAIAWPLVVLHTNLLAELANRPGGDPIWVALEASAFLVLTDPDTDLATLDKASRLIAGSPELADTEMLRPLDHQIAARTGTDLAIDAYPQLVAVAVDTGMRIAIERWASRGGGIGDHLMHVFGLIRSGLPDPRGAK